MYSAAFLVPVPLSKPAAKTRGSIHSSPVFVHREGTRPPRKKGYLASHDTSPLSDSAADFQSVFNKLAASANVNNSSSSRRVSKQPQTAERSKRTTQVRSFESTDDDVWTEEQRALYSVLSDNHYFNDESSPKLSSFLESSDSTFLPQQQSSQVVSTSRSLQSNPRHTSAAELRSRLSSIHKRRKKFSTQHSEDVPNSLLANIDSTASVDSDNISGHISHEKKDSQAFFDLVGEMRRNSASTIVSDSLRSTIVLPKALTTNPRTQIVASLPAHILSKSPTPVLNHPFLEAHTAVLDAIHPPCPRCSSPTRHDTSDQYGLCDPCYTAIYLSDPFATRRDATPDDIRFQRDEHLAVESDQTAKAVTIAASLRSPFTAMQQQNPDSRNTTSRSTTAADVPTGTSPTSIPSNGSTANPPPTPNGTLEPAFSDGWNVRAADRALRTINPIRNLVQGITVKPTPDKELIRLSVGDPTVYGNLVVSQRVTERMCSLLRGGTNNGYTMSMGSAEAREAVSRRYSTNNAILNRDDVFLTSGASGAIELALGVLANEGDNILLPKPGFPLFRTLAENLGVECKYYRLDADSGWEVNLVDITRLTDDRTRAIVVNNPSNPCGSVWSREHMEQILAVAAEMRLPILSDEVYADMVFGETEFNSFGSLSEDVPVLVVGGISKQLVVPGWRLGWLLLHDRGDAFTRGKVRQGLRQLTTRMLMPNSIAQMGLEEMLQDLGGFETVMQELEENAKFCLECLEGVPGLRCIAPQGAMYTMVQVDVNQMGLRDDMDFVERLLEEEAVFVLPGQCFEMENYVRIVFAAPKHVLSEAMKRITSFCMRQMGK